VNYIEQAKVELQKDKLEQLVKTAKGILIERGLVEKDIERSQESLKKLDDILATLTTDNIDQHRGFYETARDPRSAASLRGRY